MASIANPVRCSVKASRFSSLYSTHVKVLRSNVVLKTRLEKREYPVNGGFSGTALWTRRLIQRRSVESPGMRSAAGDSEGGEVNVPKKKRVKKKPKSFADRFADMYDLVTTLAYMSTWYIMGFIYAIWFMVIRYLLCAIFSILTKQVYNYFPYPLFVSVIHLFAGVVYWHVIQSVPLPIGPPHQPINREVLLLLVPVAAFHALGHVMSNVSFASVAVSFAHTINALEPFFNAAASQFVLGQQVPFSLWLPLAPVVIGVSMASLAELSFNWTGFVSAMISNVSFTYRSIFYKKAKTGLDSANVYAYISIIALLFCIPPAVFIEGPKLMQYGFKDAITKVGLWKFLSDLFWIGMSSHFYNRFATTSNAERDAPLAHAIGNVLQRVVAIGYSAVVFGNRISKQTGIGTAIAVAGVAVYNIIKANIIKKEIREEADAAAAAWEARKDAAKKLK